MVGQVGCIDQLRDDELLRRWRDGDLDSGEELFSRHYNAVERFFLNKVCCAVEDLVQETFVACIEARDRVNDGRKLRAYLLGIAYRVLCQHLRARYKGCREVDIEFVIAQDQAPSPEWQVDCKREQRLLLESLRHIPMNYQAIVELHYWERLTTDEIAQILALPVGTVRSRLRRARQVLALTMERLARSREELHTTQTSLQDWADRCAVELRLKRAFH